VERRKTEPVKAAPDHWAYGTGLFGNKPNLAALPTQKVPFFSTLKQSASTASRIQRPIRFNHANTAITGTSKIFTRSAKIYLPVYVENEILSMNDITFSCVDGEVTFDGAVKM